MHGENDPIPIEAARTTASPDRARSSTRCPAAATCPTSRRSRRSSPSSTASFHGKARAPSFCYLPGMPRPTPLDLVFPALDRHRLPRHPEGASMQAGHRSHRSGCLSPAARRRHPAARPAAGGGHGRGDGLPGGPGAPRLPRLGRRLAHASRWHRTDRGIAARRAAAGSPTWPRRRGRTTPSSSSTRSGPASSTTRPPSRWMAASCIRRRPGASACSASSASGPSGSASRAVEATAPDPRRWRGPTARRSSRSSLGAGRLHSITGSEELLELGWRTLVPAHDAWAKAA